MCCPLRTHLSISLLRPSPWFCQSDSPLVLVRSARGLVPATFVSDFRQQL